MGGDGMAGLHFSCDDWMGEDKSANPLFDILHKELGAFVAPEEDADWRRVFWVGYIRQSRARQLKLKPAMLRAIAAPLRRYRDALVERLGLSGPDASLEELGAFPRPMSADEEKLDCVRDLLRGYQVCERTGKPVVVYHA
jgi:hypothetical protein